MKLDFCAVCGTKDDLIEHHIVPVVYNTGTNRKNFKSSKHATIETTITVCGKHHRLIHGQEQKNGYSHKAMILRGIKRARTLGVKLGRPSNVTDEIRTKVIEQRHAGGSLHSLAKIHRIGVGTVDKIYKEHKQQLIDQWQQLL